jgi:hypothetical protein
MAKQAAAVTETIDAHPGTFEVIYRGITLASANRGQQASHIIVGDIARLNDGRMIARVEGRDSDGTAIYAYEPYSSDANLRGDFGTQPYREAERFNRELEEIKIGFRLSALHPTELRAEIQRFKEAWPELTRKFGLEDDHPAPIFNPGEVVYPQRPKEGFEIDITVLRQCADLHAAAQFGEFGSGNLAELTEEETWLASSLPCARRNIASIRLGTGLVESQFSLPAVQDRWRKLRPTQQDRSALKLTTLVRPTGNRTLARVVVVKP